MTTGKPLGADQIPAPPGFLSRLGLHCPELRAWAMYDWAASAVQTTIMVAVFPIYFIRVAGANVPSEVANQHLATANAISVAIVALLSPVLGAIADYSGRKKQLLAVFLAVGVLSTASMFFIGSGELRLAETLYVLSMSSVAASYVFYESLLPHIASEKEMDRVSTAGYAIGYTGGGVLLALNLAWIQKPEWFGLPAGEGLTPDEATPSRATGVSLGGNLVAHLLRPALSRRAGAAASARARRSTTRKRRAARVRPPG